MSLMSVIQLSSSAAALATSCRAEYDYQGVPLDEVRQNKALSKITVFTRVGSNCITDCCI